MRYVLRLGHRSISAAVVPSRGRVLSAPGRGD